MVSSSTSASTSSNRATELAECGWRMEFVTQPDGTTTSVQVPLTASEFLHPKEGYHLPNSTFHDNVAGDAKDMLTRRYASTPDIGVFRDLLIEWDMADLGDHCPDTFVAFGVQNKEQNRSKFIVPQEGVRPTLIIEVVFPRYRREDREKKVVEYARARVQEYVIIDRRTYRGQVLDEVLGYRLVSGHYQPITPDDEGRILCDTVGLWLSLQDGCLVMEDAQTGQRLKTSAELAAENQELTAENQELAAAKELAQQQAAEMAALLTRYQEQFGNLPETRKS
ncbi:MAG: Uma2 family endonuclease [Coleofasciculus sp. S288]|nr:Uma2 family endonuclease [Coleofasciculus sp. S288]